MRNTLPTVTPRLVHPRLLVAAALAAAAAFATVGLVGTWRYLDNYWVYRGFAPPHDPAYIRARGTTQRLYVASAALGGRAQPVDVYLPPGYARHPHERYPALYLLHGFPGRPGAFLLTVKAGVDEDVLVAKHRLQPLILVMPFGSTGEFTDKEWANGINPRQAWETFVARDLVRAIDRRYRTIATGAGRGIAGLSEGGYGALNIGLHHPREFRVIESWSGYELADPIGSIFGDDLGRLRYDSPLLELRHVAAALRREHDYVWLYTGSHDAPAMRRENAAFARALARHRIPYRFFYVNGGHTWGVWRAEAPAALRAAGSRLPHA